MAVDIVEPVDTFGRPLSPYELETGMPLPILPVDGPSSFTRHNDHHAWFEKQDYVHSGEPGLAAVCYSRLQHGPVTVHRRYNRFFHGTQPPSDVHDAFRLAVLNQVYVPEFAVDVSGREPRIVRPNEQQARALHAADTWRIERKGGRRAVIGSFLMDYALWQDLPDEQRQLIEQFLEIKPRMARRSQEIRERKERLAARIIGKSFETALVPVEGQFRAARREDRVRDGVPPSTWLLVNSIVGGHVSDYFRTLEFRHRLAAATSA